MGHRALLVVDVQNDLVEAGPFAREEVIGNIKRLIDESRSKGVEVIYVRHNGSQGELEPHTPGWEIFEEIGPCGDEKIIEKEYNSAFRQTELKAYLDSEGISELILVGMQTEYCIAATCKVAFEYGFKLIMPEKTNTTFNGKTLTAEMLYHHYNFEIFKDRFARVEKIEETLKSF